MNRVAKPAAVVLAGILLAPVLVVRSTRLAQGIVEACRQLWTDDFEQRRLESYGDCERRGYGYMRRVLRKFPDPDAMPTIHYRDAEGYAAVLLPELRRRREPRVLIGIGIEWRDTVERVRPMAADPARAGTWTFRTEDTDLLTGIEVHAADITGVPRPLHLTLYSTPNRVAILGRWTVVVPPGGRDSLLRLDPPLEDFAKRRSGVDFVLDIAGAVTVSEVGLAVVPVDARGLVAVQQEASCLTAVHADLLREIERGPGPWTDWLADLRRAQ